MEKIYKEDIQNSNRNSKLIDKYDEKKDISKINLLKKYIQKHILVNLSKIKNKKNTLIVNIPKSWKISDKHSDIVKEMISNNENYIQKYINLSNQIESYNILFRELLSDFESINCNISELLGTNNISNCNNETIYISNFSTKACSLLMHFTFLRILYHILNKNNVYNEYESEDSSSSSKKKEFIDEDSSSSKKDIGIQEIIEDLPDFKSELNSEKREKDYVLSKFVRDILYEIAENDKMLDLTYREVIISVGKSKEEEKSEFIRRIDGLSTQAREVDQVLKQHKLGVWAKGLSSSVWQYSEDDYKDEKNKEDFDLKAEKLAKKKFGKQDFTPDQLELFKQQLGDGERNAQEIAHENFNLQDVMGESES